MDNQDNQQLRFPLDAVTIQLINNAVNSGTANVTKIVAGTAITISPVSGLGNVTINNSMTDATIPTTDNTTNNVSISKHGWAPKAPNDATKFLDGTGAYSVPPTGNFKSLYLAGSGGGQYTTTSTSLVDVDSTNLKGTISGLTANTTKLLIRFSCLYTNNSNAGTPVLQLTDVTNSVQVISIVSGQGPAGGEKIYIEYVYVAPSTSVQFSLQWNDGTNGTSRLENSSALANELFRVIVGTITLGNGSAVMISIQTIG